MLQKFPMSFRLLLRRTPIYKYYVEWRGQKLVKEWRAAGEQGPPPYVLKWRTIREYARAHGLKTLVETGTFVGDTVAMMSRDFDQITTIELDRELYLKAKERFSTKPHINVLHGDSGIVLPELLKTLEKPALFWLDGHYSAGVTAKGHLETPIIGEVSAILAHHVRSHVLLIDDARCFTGENDYPTVTELRDFVSSRTGAHTFEVRDDIIRIVLGAGHAE
jgi:hypothetical protein